MVKMKSEKTMTHLEMAIKTLPDKNAYRHARFYIAKALNEIADVEKHKTKKKLQQQESEYEKWRQNLSSVAPMTEKQGLDAISKIDDMIRQEESKIKAKAQKEEPGQVFSD